MSPNFVQAQRMARLRQELADEVNLQLEEETLDELAYARFMTPHEGHRPAYGAVIAAFSPSGSTARSIALPSAAGFLDSQAPIEVLRPFADGRTSFLVRVPGTRPAIAVDTAFKGTETALAAYAAEAAVTIVQRLASGRLRLFVGDKVYTEEGGTWLVRPTAVAYHEKIASIVDETNRATALRVLDLCVHTLSPSGHGATLVWFPGGDDGVHACLDFSVAITPPALSAAIPDHAQAIAHALGQMDRAAILDSTGRVTRLNVTLGYSDVHGSLSFRGGTRHNSAGRYSASDDRALVFVVSADGPVTVLRAGEIVASID